MIPESSIPVCALGVNDNDSSRSLRTISDTGRIAFHHCHLFNIDLEKGFVGWYRFPACDLGMVYLNWNKNLDARAG